MTDAEHPRDPREAGSEASNRRAGGLSSPGAARQTSMERRDPYPVALAALWLTVPWTAVHFWLAWDQLPLRMATHFDGQWRANGWSSRSDAVTFAFAILGFALVIVTPACYVTRVRKASHSWPVLVLTYFVVGFICWGANSIVSRNLPG